MLVFGMGTDIGLTVLGLTVQQCLGRGMQYWGLVQSKNARHVIQLFDKFSGPRIVGL